MCKQPGATANMAQENSAGRWSAVDPGLVDPQNQPVTSTNLFNIKKQTNYIPKDFVFFNIKYFLK